MLQPGRPVVLRLEAVGSLCQLLSAPGFEPDLMAGHCCTALEGLFELVDQCESGENTLAALETVGLMLAMLGEQAITAARAILPQVSRLWMVDSSSSQAAIKVNL